VVIVLSVVMLFKGKIVGWREALKPKKEKKKVL